LIIKKRKRERPTKLFSLISLTCKYSGNIDFSIREYKAKGKDLQVDREKIPPCCSRSLRHRHGFYIRKNLQYGDLYILRFLCKNCSSTTSLLPTFLTPLKWHSTDVIYISLMLFILMHENVLNISFRHGTSPSTLYRWHSQFIYNSANFQLQEYEQRLGKRFPFRGSELFGALLNYFKIENGDSNNEIHNMFMTLQESLACPFQINGQYLPSLGIFRTILDRGG